MSNIKTKRIYDNYSKDDGYRILVDRLWPRGMKKEDAHADKWMKNVAPSTELRQWFHAEPGRWDQFRAKYIDELKTSDTVDELVSDIHKHGTVTFLYSVKDEEQNHALILKEFVKPRL